MLKRSKVISILLLASTVLSLPSTPALATGLKKLLQSATKQQPAQPERLEIRDKWAILVGVNRFADQSIPPLKFAQKSSSDLGRALKDVDSGHFGLDHVLVVNGVDANKAGIERSFNEWLYKKALPDDMVVIYFNTRLTKGANGEAILCANDTKADSADASGINLAELLRSAKQRIGSPHIVVMLDLSPAKDGLKAEQSQEIKALATATGVTIISASETFKPSFDDQQAMQSRFVHYLVEAIKTGGATYPIAMVAEYVWQKVQQDAQAATGQAQTPVLALASEHSQTTTLPLGLVVKSSFPAASISVGHPVDNLALSRPDMVPPKASTMAGPAGPTIGAKLQSRSPQAPATAAKPAPKATTPTPATKESNNTKVAASTKDDEEESFDPNLDFGPYMKKMKLDIQKKWQVPKGLETRKVTTVFSIMRDGKIDNVSITEGSGSDDVDKSAMEALQAASPLDPLPKGAPPSVDIKYVFDWKTRQGN